MKSPAYGCVIILLKFTLCVLTKETKKSEQKGCNFLPPRRYQFVFALKDLNSSKAESRIRVDMDPDPNLNRIRIRALSGSGSVPYLDPTLENQPGSGSDKKYRFNDQFKCKNIINVSKSIFHSFSIFPYVKKK